MANYGFVSCFFFLLCTVWLRRFVANPYEGIDWKKVSYHKANLHTHTTASDGKFHPHQIVDIYRNLGYTILSITDHDYMNKNQNRITFPWEKFSDLVTSKQENGLFENRCPESLGMLAVTGNELSEHHHTGSYFNDFPGSENIETSLKAITEKKGLAVIFHPGRYKNQYKIDWYLNLFRKYPVIVGIEVYNQGNRYPDDCTFWDSILSIMMPERTLWVFPETTLIQKGILEGTGMFFYLKNLLSVISERQWKKGIFILSTVLMEKRGNLQKLKVLMLTQKKVLSGLKRTIAQKLNGFLRVISSGQEANLHTKTEKMSRAI